MNITVTIPDAKVDGHALFCAANTHGIDLTDLKTKKDKEDFLTDYYQSMPINMDIQIKKIQAEEQLKATLQADPDLVETPLQARVRVSNEAKQAKMREDLQRFAEPVAPVEEK